MNEPLELSKTGESLRELTAEFLPEEMPALEEMPAPEEVPAPEAAGSSVVVPSLLRLAYAVEFLVALIAILDVWSEVGGQGHLDLMPWDIKLACTLGLSWCVVRFTAGLVEQTQIWTRRTIAWLAGILLFGIAMGGITYYYHLHEEPEDEDEDSSAASVLFLKKSTLGVYLDDTRQG
jgi:hypothetical protein